MGLLDGLLGQVLGGMTQGGARGRGALGDVLSQMGGMPGMPGAGMPRGAPLPGGRPFDGLKGAALGALVTMALQVLQRHGGLGGALGRLQQQGHGREADSWVSAGPNLPVSPDVLAQVFGRDEIGRMAEQVGLSPDEAAGGLAQVFPEVVNELTPQGRVESGSDDLVSRALEILERNRRGGA